jgi:formylglycine-generating enzyme
MNRILIWAILVVLSSRACASQINTFGTGPNQFQMTFVTIGNPNNPADVTGQPSSIGSVPYTFNMGKYEVSREMITKANAQGGLNITLADFSIIGSEVADRPATGVSWNEAARFVNWLNTSQGYEPAYKFAVQPGEPDYNANAGNLLWTESDPGFNASNQFRNSLAHYHLPSNSEWYKAAYYDPNANAGTGGYWTYPTGTNAVPTAVPGGTATGTAVYGQPLNNGPADITQAGGLSPYGTMGQGGNAFEFDETEFDLVNDNSSVRRGAWGGAWQQLSANPMRSTQRSFLTSAFGESFGIGFRVAAVPEPSTYIMAAMGIVALLAVGRRKALP